MSKQVLDISQMQHLKDLGVDTSNASACWYRVLGFGDLRVFTLWSLAFNKYIEKIEGLDTQIVPTFTLQDILDLLPLIIEHNYDRYELRIKRMVFASGVKYAVLYEEQEYINWYIMQSYENLIDAAYEMLCWCIENGYVKTNKEE